MLPYSSEEFNQPLNCFLFCFALLKFAVPSFALHQYEHCCFYRVGQHDLKEQKGILCFVNVFAVWAIISLAAEMLVIHVSPYAFESLPTNCAQGEAISCWNSAMLE